MPGEEEELAALGAPEHLRRRAQAQRDMDVWPENWATARVMLRVRRQWLRGGMDGRRYALNLTAVESVMRMLDIDDTADTLDRILVIEQEMLRIWEDHQ